MANLLMLIDVELFLVMILMLLEVIGHALIADSSVHSPLALLEKFDCV